MIFKVDVEKFYESPTFKRTASNKYGRDGVKGEIGEKIFCDYFESLGFKAHNFADYILPQKAGYDVVLEKNNMFYGFDVKNNLRPDNKIPVEYGSDGWLFNTNKTSEFISHICPKTQTIITYRRIDMQDYIYGYFWDYISNEDYLFIELNEYEKVKIKTFNYKK